MLRWACRLGQLVANNGLFAGDRESGIERWWVAEGTRMSGPGGTAAVQYRLGNRAFVEHYLARESQ